MRSLWLLVLMPSLCLARIVQIEDLVKKDKSYPVGTVIHETTGHAIEPKLGLSSSAYEVIAVFRYVYDGIERQGRKQFIKIQVQNLFLETLVRKNQFVLSNSKEGLSRTDAPTRSTVIELLAPVEGGHALFFFPDTVITVSMADRMGVSEAMLEIKEGRLLVREVARRIMPAIELPWVPPRDWPGDSQTFYLDEIGRGRTSGNDSTRLEQ